MITNLFDQEDQMAMTFMVKEVFEETVEFVRER